MNQSHLADDLLFGAQSIAAYVYGSRNQKSQRKIYHAAAEGHLPILKNGGTLFARKSELNRALSSAVAQG